MGKTALAEILAEKFQAICISTDSVKLFARAAGYGNAFTFTDSHNAWKKFGLKTSANIIKGFQAHNRVLEKLIIDIIKRADDISQHLIIEGVQITPGIFKQLPDKKIAFYLDLPDQKTHFKIFAKKNSTRKIANKMWYENYDAIKIINGYAKKSCRRAGFRIVKSIPTKILAKRLVKQIKI